MTTETFGNNGNDDTPPVSDEERERLEEQERLAGETAEERQARLDEEKADQQRAAGQDPDDDPVPLSQSGNLSAPTTVEVGGEDLELSVEEQANLRTLPSAHLATDSQGVDRIVVPDLNASGWKPAPVEPDPVEVARLEKMTAALDAQTEQRKAALGLGVEQ